MLLNYYLLMFVASFLLMLLFLSIELKVSNRYLLIFIIIMFSNFGYLGMANSKNISDAIMAVRLVNIAGCYLPHLVLLCVLDLCKISVKKGINVLLTVVDTLLMVFTFTVGFNDWFFSITGIDSFYGASYYTFEYGPVYTLYLISWGCYIFASLGIIIFSFMRSRVVSYKVVIALLLMSSTNIVIYVIERLMGARVELLPVSFILSEILLMGVLQRISLYDIGNALAANAQSSQKYGFVSFDNKLKLLNYSPLVEKIYPEIRRYKFEHTIKEKTNRFYDDIVKTVKDVIENNPHFEENSEGKIVVCDDNYYILTVERILHGKRKKKYGYFVEIKDDTEQQKYIQMIQEFNNKLEHEVDKKTTRIRKMQEDLIFGFANIVESRDYLTGGHVKRTSGYVAILMEKLAHKNTCAEARNEVYRHLICIAAPLHDIGKIAIPDSILNKPGKYEPEEYEVMKHHAKLGGDILSRTLSGLTDKKYYETAWRMAMYHHERWDGKGYPEGRKGEEIPFCARVMAVADVFDALTSKRTYKDAFSLERAFNIIQEGRGTQFDPEVVDACLESKVEFTRFCNEQIRDEESTSPFQSEIVTI